MRVMSGSWSRIRTKLAEWNVQPIKIFAFFKHLTIRFQGHFFLFSISDTILRWNQNHQSCRKSFCQTNAENVILGGRTLHQWCCYIVTPRSRFSLYPIKRKKNKALKFWWWWWWFSCQTRGSLVQWNKGFLRRREETFYNSRAWVKEKYERKWLKSW